MNQISAKSNFQLVPTVGRYLRKATLNVHPGADIAERLCELNNKT